MSVLKSYGERDRTGAPSKTYRLLNGRIMGKTDGREAVEQAIDLMLSTERWRYAVYSSDYGFELPLLFGAKERPTAETVRLMVEEALLEDDRITAVEDFSAVISGDTVKISFAAKTVFGDITVKRSEVLG